MSTVIKWLNESLENKYFLTEANDDRERFVAFAGQDLADRFNKLRDSHRIKNDAENKKYYSDYTYWENLPVEDLEAFVTNLENTPTDEEDRRIAKKGAKLRYEGNGWKIYKILTCEASKYYGKGTKWCISGKNGEEYFDEYIWQDDGEAYYFLIPDDDPYGKWCYLYHGFDYSINNTEDDEPLTIFYDASDTNYTVAEMDAVRAAVPVEVLSHLPGMKDLLNAPGYHGELQEVRASGVYVCDPNVPHQDVLLSLLLAFCADDIHTLIVSTDATEIYRSMFDGLSPSSVEFSGGSNLQVIGPGTFKYWHDITSIRLPNKLIILDDGAFAFCENLKYVDFTGTNLMEIGEMAFEGCRSLRSICLPEGLRTLGMGAFSGCTSLQTVSLPSSLTSVGHMAFCQTRINTVRVSGEYRPEMLLKSKLEDSVNIIWRDAGVQETFKELKQKLAQE